MEAFIRLILIGTANYDLLQDYMGTLVRIIILASVKILVIPTLLIPSP